MKCTSNAKDTDNISLSDKLSRRTVHDDDNEEFKTSI